MLPLPVPASVYGLVLLLAALTAGVVKLEQVKETGTYLTGIFPLLFVPAAAGIMELWAEMGQLLLRVPARRARAGRPHRGHRERVRPLCADCGRRDRRRE